MACSCSTSSSSTYIPRRYMRIDGLIFDKKYVSKLDFEGDTLYLYRKGDCCAYKYKMKEVKSTAQIAEYLLELNTCDDQQVDMTTDDHSKLINLDIENQHPIAAINGLQEKFDAYDLEHQEMWDTINAPKPIEEFLYEELPTPEDHKDIIVFVTDRDCLAFSDGIKWRKILTEDL